MKKKIQSILKERILLFDGAMGTMLQEGVLKAGACPEELNISNPEAIKDVHRAYIKTGAVALTTNTFGGNRIKLKEYNLADKVHGLNYNAVKVAKDVAGEKAFVAASIGPTGQFIEPLGEIAFDKMVDVFKEQVKACDEAGADLFKIETMMDLREFKAAIVAVREVTDKPIIAMMTFDKSLRTPIGTPPEVLGIVIQSFGPNIIAGANCSIGAQEMYEVIRRLSLFTTAPLMVQPNAGIPILEDGKTVFPDSPEDIAKHVKDFVKIGVRIIAGCCGTTPEHIRAIGNELKKISKEGVQVTRKSDEASTALASRTEYVVFGKNHPTAIIGERINPTGKKEFANELREGKTSYIKSEAINQRDRSAQVLDVNVGLSGIDEEKIMGKAVFAVNSSVRLPVCLDSSDSKALEAGLKAVDGKALVNSVNGEKKKLQAVLPLVKKYGASVIGLTLDEKGIPKTAEERVNIAERILKEVKAYGISPSNLVIDCLTLAVSAEEDAVKECLKAIRIIKKKLGLSTILGVSNISFGLPQRKFLNSAFLAMAVEAGLDAAIINPHDEMIMGVLAASGVLTNRDKRASRYIELYKGRELKVSTQGKGALQQKEETDAKDIAGKLRNAVIDGTSENIVALIDEALAGGYEAMEINNKVLIPALEEVGRQFQENIIFLPQVMQSAEVMMTAFERLKKEMKSDLNKTNKKLLFATVEGDVHDIGKNIVIILLENHGFDVIDLGKNVPADMIVKEAKRNNVDMVGLSSLMTSTVSEMPKVIEKLKSEGIKTFVAVGGAVVNQKFADKIGAELYAKDAIEAVRKTKQLLKLS